MININQIYKVTNNRYTPNTNIPTQTLKINLKTIYIIQTHKKILKKYTSISTKAMANTNTYNYVQKYK